MVLLRLKHTAVSRNLLHQCVALCAFCSGVLFIGEETKTSSILLSASTFLILLANLLAIASLLQLGRSVGILIALRQVRTGGVYRIVRHPMYASDILVRIGFLISHFNAYTLALFTLSVGAYAWRAMLEEHFLAQDPQYRQYREVVRYRFIPGVL